MASHGVILDGWRWFVMGSVRILQDDFTSGAPSLYLTFVSLRQVQGEWSLVCLSWNIKRMAVLRL